MAYVIEICKAGATLEISKYHTRRYPPPGAKRAEKAKPTTLSQEQLNIRMAEKRLRRIINHNFYPGDLYITLDYEPKNRPKDRETIRKHGNDFKRKLRTRYKKLGIPLRYIYVVERGERGALHHHILIPDGASVKELRKLWPHGRIHVDPLDGSRQYRRLAAYFIKYAVKTRRTDKSLMKQYYEPSRNLKKPKVKKIIIHRKTFRKIPQERKGYYLDKDTEQHYIDRNGFEGMRYTLVKLQI